ncbi:MAG TPA: hypothetical protein VGE60_05590 [Telluria sp.]
MHYASAESPGPESADRVRRSTPEQINRKIDHETNARVARFSGHDRQAIERRIDELDREWDVERWLEVNASTLAHGPGAGRDRQPQVAAVARHRPALPAAARIAGMVPALAGIAQARRADAGRNRSGKICVD